MQMHTRSWIEVNIGCAEVRGFLHAGSGVVKEHQQGAVTQSMASIRRQCSQRGFDLIAFEEDGFRGLRSLSRNSGHLLSLPKPFRKSLADVFKECPERPQSLVPGLSRIAPTLFEGVQELAHDISIEIVEAKLGDFLLAS